MNSFSAYFNYLLIILFAILVADTHCSTMLYDTRQHQWTISFPQNPEWREELCVPSCVLSSPLAFAPVAQRPAREKKINVPSPSDWEMCVCESVGGLWISVHVWASVSRVRTEYLHRCGVPLILSSPNSLQMQADSSFAQFFSLNHVWISFIGPLCFGCSGSNDRWGEGAGFPAFSSACCLLLQ